MGVPDAVKGLYFSLEDRYYGLLDGIQKRIPVYSVVDPVDTILPSFGVLLAIVFVLVGGGLFAILGSFSFSGGNVTLSLSFNDADGAPVEGVLVFLEPSPDSSVVSSDIVFPLSKQTASTGRVTFALPPGAYVVRVEDDAYESFSQEVVVSENASKIFSLKAKAPASLARTLIIQDPSQAILGLASPQEILLSFSCQSGAPPLSQKVFSGNVSIKQPAGCTGMSVTVTVNGFITKTQVVLGDTTVITLQSSADLGPPTSPNPVPTTGTVDSSVTDASGAGVGGVQVKLYRVPPAGSNILSDQAVSDSSGFSLFEGVSPGTYMAVASKEGFKQSTSPEFSVIAGESHSVDFSLVKSSTKKRLFIKVLKGSDQSPLAGAGVSLFVKSVGGKFLEYDSYTVDSNGIVNKELADFNGSTLLMVSRSHYITQFLPDSGLFVGDGTGPLPVLMEASAPPASNGSISNAVIADVKVVDEIGFPVLGADSFLYYPDLNGILVDVRDTDATGVARFPDLPAGSYQASASTADFDGNSPRVEGSVGKIISLPILLEVGSALVEVTVKSEQNQIISDANVSILQFSDGVVQASSITNSAGLAKLGVSSGQTVFVRVEKPGYLPFSSVPFDILKDNTHKILIEVSLTSASPDVDMALTSIYQISSSGSQSLASSLIPGNTYAFHFAVKSPADADELMGVVRLNGDTPSLLSSDVGKIIGAQVAQGGVGFYTNYSPSDEFAPSGPVDSGVPAKIAVNTIGDVSGGSYAFIVLASINSTAVSNQDTLKINYRSGSSTQSSALFESSFVIGKSLPPQEDFLYLFYLTQEGSGEKIPISSAHPAILEQNKNYTLDYLLTNVSGQGYSSATAKFVSTGGITPSPSTVNLPGFDNDKSVGGSISLRSTNPCSSSASYCASIEIRLGGIASGKVPVSYTLPFFTFPEKQITVNASPAFLIPDQDDQVVLAVALDKTSGSPLSDLLGLEITGQIFDSLGMEDGDSISFTETQEGSFIKGGSFIAAIPSAVDGSVLELSATAPGYLSGYKTIPISTSSILNLSQDFSCLTITPPSTPFSLIQNANGVLKVQTSGCGDSLFLYTGGYGSLVVPVKNAGVSVHEGSPVSLDADDSLDLTVTAPSLMGIYPLRVFARFEEQSSYSLVEELDLLVKPVSPATQCLDLSSYSFDLTQNGSASSAIINRCNPLVKDAFYPSAGLGGISAYAHAIPPLLTPQLQSPGSPVPFTWQVQVDYGSTSSTQVNFSEHVFDSLVVGNWTRYRTSDVTSFRVTKGDFGSAESVVTIPDSQLINNNYQLENQDPDLFPHLSGDSADPKDPKSLLFETTLFVRSGVELDAICIDADGVSKDDLNVLLDGVSVQTVANWDCSPSSIPAALEDVALAPGVHSLQIFLRDVEGDNYKVWASYKDSALTKGDWKPFSYQSTITGLMVNGTMGLPMSSSGFSGNFVDGPFVFPTNPANGDVVPSQHRIIPKHLETLTGPVADILSNATGVEHEKVSFVRLVSSDPQVRVFLKGLDVYAQFIGFDDPVVDSQKQQFVVVEDQGLSDTAYTVMRLDDYSTGSPYHPGLAVGVLVDSTSSVLAKIPSLVDGAGAGSLGKNNGLCALLDEMESGFEYYSGAPVRFKVFWLSSPIDYEGYPSQSPCSGMGLDVEVLSVTPPQGMDAGQDIRESWALGAETLADHSFWNAEDARLMIVLTDNAPLGIAPGSPLDTWGGTEQEDAVDDAIDSLKDNGIRAAVLYVTPLESTSTSLIELMEKFSRETSHGASGVSDAVVVEALEFPPFLDMDLGNNPLAWDQSNNNKVIQRLAQHAFPIGSQDIVVKLVSHPPNACIGENGEIGFTGYSALPRVQYNWEWDKVGMDLCARNPSNPGEYLYCDGFQFLISLSKRLEALRNVYDSNASNPDPSLAAQVPQLAQFDAYLIRDHFNQSMRNDMVSYATDSSFADAPDYFKSDFAGGAWKDYFSSPEYLSFSVNGSPSSLLPSSGLYRVSIDFNSSTIPFSFFSGSAPSAAIVVSLDLLTPSSSLPGYSDFYEIPLDGLLGLDESTLQYARDGYGTAFTGNADAILATTDHSYSIKTYSNAPGLTALNTYHVNASPSFIGLNTSDSRGVALEIDRANQLFTFNPSVPTPLLAEWSSGDDGKGDLYYGIQSSTTGQFLAHSTASSPLAKWKPLASAKKESSLGCIDSSACEVCLDGGGNPFLSALAYDSNPVAGESCSLAPAFSSARLKAFGFHSGGGMENASYLSTILYSDVQGGQVQDYSIWLACNPGSIFPVGKIAVGNQSIDEGGESTSLKWNGNPSLQQSFDSARVMANMVDLIGKPVGSTQGWSCLSYEGNTTKVYWNAEELYSYAASQSSSAFSDFSGNACTSTGTPFSGGGTYTLEEHADVSIGSLPSTKANQLCGLWTDQPGYNYYGVSGIPLPAGTQRYLVTGSISTGDPVSSDIQYRSNPTNCPSGAGSLKASCGIGTSFTVPVCQSNDQRVWSNT